MPQQTQSARATVDRTNGTGGNGSTANRPVQTLRYGNIKAAIWRNEVDAGNASRPMYNVTFSRSYKGEKDEWHDSGSFGVDDLLVVAKLANEAHSFIFQQRAKDAAEQR